MTRPHAYLTGFALILTACAIPSIGGRLAIRAIAGPRPALVERALPDAVLVTDPASGAAWVRSREVPNAWGKLRVVGP